MNGRIERMNRTGSDAVRSMLSDAGLPEAYWAEAYSTFAYIHNRTGVSLDPSKTPFEALHGKKPSLAHIRPFGCLAYVPVAPELRSKLNAKARNRVLVGYNRDAAYRLIDPVTHKVEFSRDVVFDEHRTFLQGNEIVDTEPEPIVPRRSERLASKYSEVAALVLSDIPRSASEALRSSDSHAWDKAMLYETDKLSEMGCWSIVERPPSVHVIKGMWVFAKKQQADGSFDFRARWVARGDSQLPGLEFNETFAAAGDFRVAKVIMAISSHPNGCLITVDINSAYLHSPLLETNLYVEYPNGYSVSGFRDPVCHLKKALYGLRQGARAWSVHFSNTMDSVGLRRLVSAPSCYYRSDSEGESLIASHVDDLNCCCISPASSPRNAEAERFKVQLGNKFKFKEKDAREKANILGMTVSCDDVQGTVKLSVEQKIARSLERYSMENANPVRTPMDSNAFKIFDDDTSEAPDPTPWPYSQLIGELLWIATVVRIDIAFAVNSLARFARKPKKCHWEAAKRVLRYLAGTKDLGLVYRTGGDMRPVGYADSDWAGDKSDRKSISGFVFMLGGGPVDWQSKKQTVVAKSTAEAEYISVSSAACEAIWMRNFFAEINRDLGNSPLYIHVDNNAAIEIARDPVYISSTKHIDIQVHHIRDEISKNRIALLHVASEDNPADILTKPLDFEKHTRCIRLLNMG